MIRLPRYCLHSSPSCLHSSHSYSSPSRTPLPMPPPRLRLPRPPPSAHHHIHKAAPGPQTNRLPCRLPPSAFPAHPHTHSVSSCAGSVGFFLTPVCLYILVPLSRAREQCARTQKEGGGWDLPFPPTPPGGARALCLPPALSGCT